MRPALALLGLVLILALAVPAGTAAAHSAEEIENALSEREKFFQPVDRPAPGFRLADADGDPVTLADLAGRVVVLHFVYASCPDVCPLHAEKLAEVQAMINETPMRDQVRFVSVTTDPRRDTPKVMRAYGPRHGLDPANWTMLTAAPGRPEDATRTLARDYGHRFRKQGGGYQLHGVVTHVIDGTGRWRANFHGLKFDPASLVTFVNGLVNAAHHRHGEPEKGLWERLLGWF